MKDNERNVPPAAIVILGASGDLTQRKLVPALHSLCCDDLLSPSTRVLGVARSEFGDGEYREHLYEGIAEYARHNDEVCAQWEKFGQRFSYLSGGYDDPDTYRRVAERLAALDAAENGTEGNRLFYLAVPPSLGPGIIRKLGEAGLNRSPGWTRVIVEKPFGRDLESAHHLNEQIHEVFREDQVYRIDHYLGKETVQNIMTFRFANAIFEPIWNMKYVDQIQITVAESGGVGRRGGYYDQAGVLRDMFQNHLVQLLTLTAMEPPAVWDADALRDEKVKVIRAARAGEPVVRGQYRGYRDEEGVAPDSRTPTFAALPFYVDNWRWQGVPFFLRSGKALATKLTEVAVVFKCVPQLLFPRPSGGEIAPNMLSLCLQPNEGIHLRFEAKHPGTRMRTRSVDMEFHYAEGFEGKVPEAYERLLLDALQGDASLFARADEIELAWGLIDPILERWHGPEVSPPSPYDRGSWGPAEAKGLLKSQTVGWAMRCGRVDSGLPGPG